MNIFSIIGTGAAFLNYKKAKANYEALKEQFDALQAAVQTYNYHKYDEYAEHIDTKPIDLMPGVHMTTILRVGNLVGKNIFRAQTSIVLSNTSDSTYHIHNAIAECMVLKTYVNMFEVNGGQISQRIIVNRDLQPGETMEITLPGGVSSWDETKLGELRDLICQAAGKKLITSCPKLNIENGATGDIQVQWSLGEDSVKTARTIGLPGVLRYCGEAFYPKGA